MGDQGHRLVVLSGAGREPTAAESPGQVFHHRQCRRIGLGIGGGNPGAPLEQIALACLHTGLRRSRHGVAGYKAWVTALPLLQHRLFHRTDIGDHCLSRQRLQQLRIWLEQRRNR